MKESIKLAFCIFFHHWLSWRQITDGTCPGDEQKNEEIKKKRARRRKDESVAISIKWSVVPTKMIQYAFKTYGCEICLRCVLASL